MTVPSPGSTAADLTLQEPDGDPVSLSSYWRRQPVVAAFLRHYG